MKIEQIHKVGYFDVDLNLTMRPSSIVNLFQNVATVHSEKVGFSFSALKARNKAWVLYQMGIHIHRMPALDENFRPMHSPYLTGCFLSHRKRIE